MIFNDSHDFSSYKALDEIQIFVPSSVVKGRELVDVRQGALGRVQRQKLLADLTSDVEEHFLIAFDVVK